MRAPRRREIDLDQGFGILALTGWLYYIGSKVSLGAGEQPYVKAGMTDHETSFILPISRRAERNSLDTRPQRRRTHGDSSRYIVYGSRSRSHRKYINIPAGMFPAQRLRGRRPLSWEGITGSERSSQRKFKMTVGSDDCLQGRHSYLISAISAYCKMTTGSNKRPTVAHSWRLVEL